jgi:3'(2'), 5'-bisphosphate nucleotidase
MESYARERTLAAQLARQAGAIALKHRLAGVSAVEKPHGDGPVTAADKESDAFIRAALQKAFPLDGLLTEETPDDGEWRHQRRVWMVDPLDGTKEYVKGGDDFAAMIGLCVDGIPVVGAVYKPVGDVLYTAAQGEGASMEDGGKVTPLKVTTGQPELLVVAVSKSHRNKTLEDILAALGPLTEFPSGSVGLKIGLIATGRAHAYINGAGKACLWDSCAPYAILREAGGTMTDLFGGPIRYDGTLQHREGMFCATLDVHGSLKERVADIARRVVAARANGQL